MWFSCGRCWRRVAVVGHVLLLMNTVDHQYRSIMIKNRVGRCIVEGPALQTCGNSRPNTAP